MPQVPVISIIDDDASVRAAANRLVRSLGYIAYPFASAREFLESSQLNDTSCLIADLAIGAAIICRLPIWRRPMASMALLAVELLLHGLVARQVSLPHLGLESVGIVQE